MSNGFVLVASNNAIQFTNALLNDFMIYPKSNTQRLVLGVNSNAPASIIISSNQMVFGSTVSAATINATTLQQGGTAVSVTGHVHDANAITTGTLVVARGGTGTTTSTGTGSLVLSAGPTFTGTVTAADVNVTGTVSTAGVARIDSTGTIQNIANMIGLVLPFAGTTPPTGWLLCWGQAVSRTTYSGLYTVVTNTYGAGDGSTTFNLPDLRGRVIAGVDNMGGTAANKITSGVSGITGTTLGAVGGNEGITLTGAQSGVAAHSHAITDPGHVHGNNAIANGGSPAFGDWGVTNQSVTNKQVGASVYSAVTSISIQNATAANASQAHPNVQPTIMMNYIIKF